MEHLETNIHPARGCCLLVEDNAFALDIMTIYLQRLGFSVDTAADGQAALDKYLRDPARYGIIFMDLQMPVMSGYETTARIRSSGCDGAHLIPIIAMSGDPLSCLTSRGFSDCLKKPFELRSILPILRRFLDQ